MKLRKVSLLGVAAGAMLLAASGWAADNPPVMEEDARASMRLQGAPAVPGAMANEIRSTLGSSIKAALAGNFVTVSEYLAKADRDRFGRFTPDDRASLKSVGDQIDTDWRNKYRKTSDWSSDDMLSRVFNNYQISKGADDKHASVVIPESHGLPPVTLALVNEGMLKNAWRIDLPDSISREQLRDKLKDEMAAIESDKTSWPSDPAMTEQIVAHRILSTLGQSQMM